MSRDDYAQQGKQFVSDLRDTASKKVADNEDSIRGAIGKAARWVDEKTGGKYADQIGKAEAKAGEGVEWAAKQGAPESSGEPGAPGASAGDGTSSSAGPAGPAGPQDPATPPPPRPATPEPGATPKDGSDWPRPPQG